MVGREMKSDEPEAFVGVRWLDTLCSSRKVRLVPGKSSRVGNDLGRGEMANEAASSVSGRGGEDCTVGGWVVRKGVNSRKCRDSKNLCGCIRNAVVCNRGDRI